EAEDGMKYAAITLNDNGVKKTYVVNESGRIQKGKEVKDDDDTKFKTDDNGILTHVDGKEVGSQTFDSPIEPVFEE
ncbi:MAG: cell wall-binding protein, partial [Lachnospiraceae bacterium]|nr:cell wall-binding protein [Lachnospiraceae bacterium]